MAVRGVAFQGVIECGAMSPAEASRRVLHVLGADGRYQVVQTGPNEIQFARRYRPTWAIVVAVLGALFLLIGLVFLFVTNTELCIATVDNDHRGTRLRLSGRLHAATLTALKESLRCGAGPSVPVPGAPVDALAASAPPLVNPVAVDVSAHLPTPPPTATAAPARAVVSTPAPPAAPVVLLQPANAFGSPASESSPPSAGSVPAHPGGAPQWLSSVPGCPPGDPGSPLMVDLTVGRPDVSRSSGVALLMDDGRRLIPGALLLIGRDPAPAPAEQHATLVDVPDTELTVSKTHLSVLHEGSQLVVVDRGSTNGSVVVGVDGRERNLVPHQQEVVAPGELVRFGDRSFRVVPVMEGQS